MKALVGDFNQEKALVGAFSVIVQPVVEPMEHYTALLLCSLLIRPRAAVLGPGLSRNCATGLNTAGPWTPTGDTHREEHFITFYTVSFYV